MRFLIIIQLAMLPLITVGHGLADSVFIINKIDVLGAKIQNDNITGSRRTVIGPAVIDDNITRSLGDVLGDNSLVFIKSMGQGGLATASFRGTSSNHTQVNWNGININSPMLGNFDFSQIPAFFTDEVTLYHGGGYLKNGTGALGGSINLNNSGQKGNKVRFLGEYGSNQTYTGGLHIGFSTKKIYTATRLYFQRSENNFEYINKVLRMEPFKERRENAQFMVSGAMQEFVYNLNRNNSIGAVAWFIYSDRNLPQPIMIYYKPEERQRSNNLRTVAYLTSKLNRGELKTSFSYLRDFMKYNIHYINNSGDREENNTSQSFIVKEDFTLNSSDKFKITSALFFRHDKVESESYAAPEVSRNTLSIQGGTEWKPVHKITLSLSGMGEANNDIVMPTFSSGVKYVLIDNRLDASSSLSYNYRAPTLNDLYWQPGGNAELKPERGFSYDATMSFRPHIGSVALRFEATYYRMTIDNWIAWMPGNTAYWSPKNIKDVLSQGVEFFTELSFKAHSLIFNYGYSQSVSKVNDATYGKQLPYVPLNRWNVRYALNAKKIVFWCNAAFTDRRYTNSDERYSTPAYLILDAEAGYSTTRHSMLKLRANNIFNTYYESTKFNPMPLRSVYVSAIISF